MEHNYEPYEPYATAPPGYVHKTHIPLIYGFSISFPIAACLCIGLRLYARKYILGGIGPDDWLAVQAVLASMGVTGLALWGTTVGYGTHIWEVDMRQFEELRTMMAALPMVTQIGTMSVQLSLLTFYRRLSPSHTFHNVCNIMMFVVCSLSTSTIVLSGVWCFHEQPEGFCNISPVAGLLLLGLGVSTNLIIFCLPIPMLWRLKNVSVLKRLGLIFIFSVGLIAVVACIGRAFIYRKAAMSSDPTWELPWIAVVSQIELGAGLSCACAPMLRALFLKTATYNSRAAPRPVGDEHKGPRENEFGTGTLFVRRARGNWDAGSLTATWQGVQRYYHTRWGRKRSIIEVADLEGFGVLDPLPPAPAPQKRREEGVNLNTFASSGVFPESMHQTPWCAQSPGENKGLQLPAAAAVAEGATIPRTSSDGATRFSSKIPPLHIRILEPRDPAQTFAPNLKARESEDVLISSMAPMAGADKSLMRGMKTTPAGY